MLNETNIKCFLSLAQTLNFTKTAKELYMSQQAVSQHISRLEDDMGVPLFMRTRHFVALTQAGKSFYEFFGEVQMRYQGLLSEARMTYSAMSRVINVGYQNWIDLGPAVSAALNRTREENLEFEVQSVRTSPGALIDQLMNRELQLIVLYGRWAPRAEGMEISCLKEVPMALMVASENPLATEEATYETFLREPFIIDSFPREGAAECHRRARQEINSFGLSPSKVVVVPDRDSAYTAAEMGQGVVLTTTINRITHSNHLKAYRMPYTETLVCVWHADEENSMVVRYARELARAYKAETAQTEI